MNNATLERQLRRWTAAEVLDAVAAERIRQYEFEQRHGSATLIKVALMLGALMVAAGVLLFVAAHWDNMSPAARFSLVLAMVAGFHVAAAVIAERMKNMAIALHAVGSASLGAGIYLAGQIFNLQEHWPTAILLWAVGAAIAWALLRDAVQATLTAVLVPAWICSEWEVRFGDYLQSERFGAYFVLMVAIVYFSVRLSDEDSHFRRALMWIGGLAIIPSTFAVVETHGWYWRERLPLPTHLHVVGFAMAFLLPIGAAWLMRGRKAWVNAAIAAWVLVLGRFDSRDLMHELAIYGWCALGAIALVAWGIAEHRRERINLGVIAFAADVIAFYFATMLDKLGRSAALVAFGLLFLLGGWELERVRRKLVAHVQGGAR